MSRMYARRTLDLNWLVHQPARLGMMMLMAEHPCTFGEIEREMALNRGSIARHTDYLEAVGYLNRAIRTATGTIRRATTFHLTADGRDALTVYYQVAADIAAQLRCILQH